MLSARSRNFDFKWENLACEASMSMVVLGAIGALFLVVLALSGSKLARKYLTWIVLAMAAALLAIWHFTIE